MILIIGWRGSPKIKDEPQHNVKGKITKELLKLLNINFTILRKYKDLKNLDKLIKSAKKKSIVACLIEQGTLKKYKKNNCKRLYKLDKDFFLIKLLKNIPRKSKIVASTGYNSRQIMNLRKKHNLNYGKDFYMVGGMGHTSSVALGYALSSKKYNYLYRW